MFSFIFFIHIRFNYLIECFFVFTCFFFIVCYVLIINLFVDIVFFHYTAIIIVIIIVINFTIKYSIDLSREVFLEFTVTLLVPFQKWYLIRDRITVHHQQKTDSSPVCSLLCRHAVTERALS